MTESSECLHPGNKPLDPKIRQKVLEYYENQENIRELPGKKDFKSIKTDDGKRIHKQKKQLCYNLRELHCNFLERYPDFRVGFTKFVELKPQHCVLTGAAGTHTVCVCTTHQNPKLMLEGK